MNIRKALSFIYVIQKTEDIMRGIENFRFGM